MDSWRPKNATECNIVSAGADHAEQPLVTPIYPIASSAEVVKKPFTIINTPPSPCPPSSKSSSHGFTFTMDYLLNSYNKSECESLYPLRSAILYEKDKVLPNNPVSSNDSPLKCDLPPSRIFKPTATNNNLHLEVRKKVLSELFPQLDAVVNPFTFYMQPSIIHQHGFNWKAWIRHVY